MFLTDKVLSGPCVGSGSALRAHCALCTALSLIPPGKALVYHSVYSLSVYLCADC